MLLCSHKESMSKKKVKCSSKIKFSINFIELCVLATQLWLTLCHPMDCSPPGSSVHEFSRQEHWSGLPFLSPGDLSNPGTEPVSPALQANSLPSEPPRKPIFFCSTKQLLGIFFSSWVVISSGLGSSFVPYTQCSLLFFSLSLWHICTVAKLFLFFQLILNKGISVQSLCLLWLKKNTTTFLWKLESDPSSWTNVQHHWSLPLQQLLSFPGARPSGNHMSYNSIKKQLLLQPYPISILTDKGWCCLRMTQWIFLSFSQGFLFIPLVCLFPN